MYDNEKNDPGRSGIAAANGVRHSSVPRQAVAAVALIALLFPLAAAADRTGAENKVRLGNEAYFDGNYPAAEDRFTEAGEFRKALASPRMPRAAKQLMFAALVVAVIGRGR